MQSWLAISSQTGLATPCLQPGVDWMLPPSVEAFMAAFASVAAAYVGTAAVTAPVAVAAGAAML